MLEHPLHRLCYSLLSMDSSVVFFMEMSMKETATESMEEVVTKPMWALHECIPI